MERGADMAGAEGGGLDGGLDRGTDAAGGGEELRSGIDARGDSRGMAGAGRSARGAGAGRSICGGGVARSTRGCSTRGAGAGRSLRSGTCRSILGCGRESLRSIAGAELRCGPSESGVVSPASAAGVRFTAGREMSSRSGSGRPRWLREASTTSLPGDVAGRASRLTGALR
jgi:hypothetical protein